MEKFSFFNDVNDDRVYYAEDWARHLKKYFTNGIFNNELNVVANNDMTITIKEGDANIEGYRYTNTGDLVKTIDNADGTLNRIDNVVLRLDLTNRLISAQIIKGTFADKPVAPELVRTSTIYDLRIAKISIPAGTTTITQDLITDTRFITSDCGNVISTVQTPDTENLFIQMQTLFEKQINELNNNFEIWFDSIKNQLDSDAAGNLQNQINNLNSNKVDNAKFDLDSNNLQLLANGKNVGDSVHIPTGITDTATGEEDLKIVNNRGVAKFSLEGKTEQKSYTGKNILDYISNLKASSDGLTSVINDDGSITTSGKPTSNYKTILNSINIIDILEDGETYTFSQSKANDKLYMQINAKKKDGTYSYYSLNDSTKSKQEIIVNKSIYETYTLNIQTGLTSNWGESSLTITNKYMFCKGTDTAGTSFEPYVGGIQSPNPDYPQEIENISGVENLFDKSNYNASKGVSTSTGELYNSDTSFATNYIKVNVGYYTVNSASSVANTVYGAIYDSNKKFLESIFADVGVKTFKISNKNAKYMRLTALNSNLDNYQIERGNKMHSLVSYGSNYLQLENVGENILNIDETPFTVKKITSQGNVLYWSGYSGVNDFVKVKEKTTYKFSSNEVNKVCYIDYYDKNKNYLSRTGTAVDYFTTPENCKYIKFAINLELIPTNAQLREGTIIKSYEPYKKKIINVDLKGNELCSDKEQTSKDELIIENGRAKIIKKYDEVILTGSENWSINSSSESSKGYYEFSLTLINKPTLQVDLICNKFQTGLSYNNSKEQIRNRNDSELYINVLGTRLSSLNAIGFKSWLKSQYDSGNPVRVQYELVEPKVIDLGEVDFELLEGNSTLNLEEDLKSNMSIKYYTDSTVVDLKKKVENKQNVILHGTTVPSNDLGEDGDIYLQHN